MEKPIKANLFLLPATDNRGRIAAEEVRKIASSRRDIQVWSPDNITPGTDHRRETNNFLQSSHLVVPFITPDFISQQDTMDLLMRTLQLKKAVLPIYTEFSSLSGLQEMGLDPKGFLPEGGRPLSVYFGAQRAEQMLAIAEKARERGLDKARNELSQKQQQLTSQEPQDQKIWTGADVLHDAKQKQPLEITDRQLDKYARELNLQEQQLGYERRQLDEYAKSLDTQHRQLNYREQQINQQLTIEREKFEREKRLFSQREVQFAQQVETKERDLLQREARIAAREAGAKVVEPTKVNSVQLQQRPTQKEQAIWSTMAPTSEEQVEWLEREMYDPKRVQIHILHGTKRIDLVDQVRNHHILLVRKGLVETTVSNDQGGSEIGGLKTHKITQENEVERIRNSDIILLLVDSDFYVNNHAYNMFQTASGIRQEYQEYKDKNYRIIPVLLRPTNDMPDSLNKLQYLPNSGQAISKASDRDESLAEVTGEVRKVVELMRSEKLAKTSDRH